MSDKELSVALKAQADRDNDPQITDRVCDEIKNSVIFQYNWQDLLQSAPIAVSATGACYAACFSDAGMRVQLQPPPSGQFRSDKMQTSLSANLIVCGDLGRMAFMEAENGLLFVKDISNRAQNKVSDIIDVIADPPAARKMLKPQMTQLKRFADDAYDKVTAIDKRFDEWLVFTCELHAACVGTESSTAEQLHATEIGLAVEQARFDSQKNTVAEAKAASEKLGKTLDATTDAFKKASDEFPDGWDILGQQVVGSLADCFTGALTTFTQNYAMNMNPVARATSGISMFGDLIHPKSGGNNDESTGIHGTAPQPPPLPQKPVPPFSTDPAYSAVQKDMVHLNTLHGMLVNGTDNGVDWDGLAVNENATKTIAFVARMLSDAVDAFASQATSDPPSSDLNDILSVATNIANSVKKAAENGRKMGNSFPEADSKDVKDWQERFGARYSTAQKMFSIARSLPGAAPAGMPLMANSPDPAVQIAQTNAKSAQAQAVLEAAKNRLTTAQDAMLKTQDNFIKGTQLLLEQENKMTEIQGALTKLTQSKLSLTEIKAVLETCIRLIVQVKKNIMDLCTFFKAMSRTVEAIVKYAVQGFLDTVASNLASDGSTDLKVFKIGDYTLDDLQRSMLYQAAVSVRAQFSVFGDIAAMWGKLSMQYVMPGVKMLDQLSLAEPDQAKRQRLLSSLQQWATESIAGVREIAGTTKQTILDDMDGRVNALEAVTKKLPPSTSMKAAIEAGTQESSKAAQDALVANSSAKLVNRFAGTRK